MEDIFDIKQGDFRLINDYEKRTYTHELRLLTNSNVEICGIVDELRDHRNFFIDNMATEMEYETKFHSTFDAREKSVHGLAVRLTYPDKIIEYDIKIPMESLPYLEKNPNLIVVDKNGDILTGFPVGKEEVDDLIKTAKTMDVVDELTKKFTGDN